MLIPCLQLYSGYFIPYDQIKPWFIWLFWLNPLAFAYKGGLFVLSLRSVLF